MTDAELLAHLATGHPDLAGRTWQWPDHAWAAHDLDHGFPRSWPPPLDHVHPSTTAYAYGGPPQKVARR